MADIILILVLFLFVYSGYRNGFAKTLINATSNIISVVFSVIFTNPVARMICNSPIGTAIRNSTISYIRSDGSLSEAAVGVAADGICMAVSSVISFILIALVVKIIIRLIAGAMGIISGLPLIKQANRALGAIIGGIGGCLICYVVIGFIAALSHNATLELDLVIENIENSFVCSFFYYNNIVGNALSSVL